MKYPHWYYFIALVNDLEATSRYVEFSTDNFNTYSTEYSKLILAACSEIDVVAKLLCKKIKTESSAKNIVNYRDTITPVYKYFASIEVVIRRYELTIIPWKSWAENQTPEWWSNYNDIKHQRDKHYTKSNLQNAFASVAGLAVMVSYLYHEEISEHLIYSIPDFLFLDNHYNKGSIMVGKIILHLPDFPKN